MSIGPATVMHYRCDCLVLSDCGQGRATFKESPGMCILMRFPFVASEKGSAGGPTGTVPEPKQQVMAA